MKKIINRIEKLAARDDQGGFIYQSDEAHRSADKIILETLEGLGAKPIADAYRKVKHQMCFEYGNE
jgi:hypothetical protein